MLGVGDHRAGQAQQRRSSQNQRGRHPVLGGAEIHLQGKGRPRGHQGPLGCEWRSVVGF